MHTHTHTHTNTAQESPLSVDENGSEEATRVDHELGDTRVAWSHYPGEGDRYLDEGARMGRDARGV